MAWAQQEEICVNPGDAQKALRCLMEAQIKDEKIRALEQALELAKREKALADQELEMQKKLTSLAERERDLYKVAFEKEKDITDRALKLAEVSKPGSDWKLQGLLAVAAILLGVVIGK